MKPNRPLYVYADDRRENVCFTWYYNPHTNEIVRMTQVRPRAVDREALEGQGCTIITVQDVGLTNREYWAWIVNSWIQKHGVTPKPFRI